MAVAINPPEVRDPRATKALLVAATAMFLGSFVITASNIAVPVLEKDFPDVSLATISWVVSGFNVAQVTLMLLGGRLADRWGRRRVFLWGLVVFILGAVASTVAPTIGFVIAARILQAVGMAMVIPASLAAVLPAFPISRHASVVSIWAAMGILGAAVAPTLSSAILEVGSWRMVFAVVVPFAAAAWWGGYRLLLVDVPTAPDGRLDVVGTLSGTVAVGSLAIAIVQGRFWGWTSPAILFIAATSAIAFWLFFHRCRVHPEPLVNLDLLKIRSFAVMAGVIMLMSVATTATWFMYPIFMTDVWGYSVFQIGLAISPGAVAMIPVTVLAGRLADRYGYRPLLVGGCLTATAGVAWMAAFLGPEARYVWAFLPGTFMIGLGMGAMTGPANSAAIRDVGAAFLGSANAAYNTMRSLGAALGVALVAAILGATQGADREVALSVAWWVVVAVMAPSPLLIWWLYPRPVRLISSHVTGTSELGG
jgi:EmrB/QacA subfamily drug resistance transporter